ncbi:unnamed protein product [Closterium sp. NIES-54]
MAFWKSTGTYVDEVPPPGGNIVSGMWIFRVKRPPGSPPVFKARYLVRGFSQRQGVDYFQTFYPNPKMTTLWVLLHVAAQHDYELHSLDFSTAFLQGSLHEEIWLRRPPGFTGSFPPGTQWNLRRPVYGLRQAPREWPDTLRTTLAALGFTPSTADPSLFLRTDTLLPLFYILVYVNDLVFATADTAGLAHVKSELQKRHTCTDLGELRSYLGLQITQDRAHRTITLTQSHMVQQVLQRFDFTYSSPHATPLSTRHSLSALPSDESVEPIVPYPELVGYLMYLMTCTRPDLAYPLSILARYVAPGRHRPEHMAAAKRVLRYLCSTSSLGLVLGGRSLVVLTGHADASSVDDLATQRSSQGYTFSLGSGSVSWRSTRSSSVISCSCEAEIYAGAMAAQELRWLTYLLTDLGEPPSSPPVLYVDNKAMLALCRGQLRLAYVASQTNTADIFTKALQPCDHQRFCTMLGNMTMTSGSRRPHVHSPSPEPARHPIGAFSINNPFSTRHDFSDDDNQDWNLPLPLLESPPHVPDQRAAPIDWISREQFLKFDTPHIVTPRLALLARNDNRRYNTWYLDSCCGQHMVGSEHYISNAIPTPTVTYDTMANNTRLRASAQGIVVLKARGSRTHITLNDVLIVQNLLFNLLSAAQLMDCGVDLSTDPETHDILLHYTIPNKTRKQIGREHSENSVYILDFSIPDCSGDSQELIDLVPLRFKHIHHHDWKLPDGRPWVPHHPHPRELALHDPDPNSICRDFHTL